MMSILAIDCMDNYSFIY